MMYFFVLHDLTNRVQLWEDTRISQLKKFVEILERKNIKYCLTFDDGYKTILDLERLNIIEDYSNVILFVATSLIGKEGYCNWDDLRHLRANGCEIGSHTHSHLDLSLCSFADLKRDVTKSITLIEKNLQTKVNILSLPYGNMYSCCDEAVAQLGITRVFGSRPGRDLKKTFHVNRVSINATILDRLNILWVVSPRLAVMVLVIVDNLKEKIKKYSSITIYMFIRRYIFWKKL